MWKIWGEGFLKDAGICSLSNGGAKLIPSMIKRLLMPILTVMLFGSFA
jgi:hypothetical protein